MAPPQPPKDEVSIRLTLTQAERDDLQVLAAMQSEQMAGYVRQMVRDHLEEKKPILAAMRRAGKKGGE